MEISTHVIISLLVVHYVADFIFQTGWQAVNKSKNNVALVTHVTTYSLPFIVFGFWFWLVTFVTHFATDYITSRLVAKFASQDKRSAMFRTIGADQLIHGVTLVLTYVVLSHYNLIFYSFVGV